MEILYSSHFELENVISERLFDYFDWTGDAIAVHVTVVFSKKSSEITALMLQYKDESLICNPNDALIESFLSNENTDVCLTVNSLTIYCHRSILFLFSIMFQMFQMFHIQNLFIFFSVVLGKESKLFFDHIKSHDNKDTKKMMRICCNNNSIAGLTIHLLKDVIILFYCKIMRISELAHINKWENIFICYKIVRHFEAEDVLKRVRVLMIKLLLNFDDFVHSFEMFEFAISQQDEVLLSSSIINLVTHAFGYANNNVKLPRKMENFLLDIASTNAVNFDFINFFEKYNVVLNNSLLKIL